MGRSVAVVQTRVDRPASADCLKALRAEPVIEGLTEFLPISSTGHLVLAGSLLDFVGGNSATFEIVIQTGAILAVIWEYRVRLLNTLTGLTTDRRAQRFALNVVIGFLPAVVLALIFNKFIKSHLFHPVPVAVAFIVGGLIILLVEYRHRKRYGARDLEGARHARVEVALRVLVEGARRGRGDEHRGDDLRQVPRALSGRPYSRRLGDCRARRCLAPWRWPSRSEGWWRGKERPSR